MTTFTADDLAYLGSLQMAGGAGWHTATVTVPAPQQPRERAVHCTRCLAWTCNYNRVCDACALR